MSKSQDAPKEVLHKGYKIRRAEAGSMRKILTEDGRGKVHKELDGLWTSEKHAKIAIDGLVKKLELEKEAIARAALEKAVEEQKKEELATKPKKAAANGKKNK
jgi:hypothetical protein